MTILQTKTYKNIIQLHQKIPDHPYRVLIIESCGSKKIDPLLNLINHEPGIDEIYLYTKDPNEAKYQLLINKQESMGLKNFNDSKAQMIWKTFINILKNTIQIKNKNY